MGRFPARAGILSLFKQLTCVHLEIDTLQKPCFWIENLGTRIEQGKTRSSSEPRRKLYPYLDIAPCNFL